MSSIFFNWSRTGQPVANKIANFEEALSYRGKALPALLDDNIAMAVTQTELPGQCGAVAVSADLYQGSDVLVACHGSLYDLGALYQQLNQSCPEGIALNPARAVADAYRQWGDDALANWCGELSVVIWDVKHSQLLAARDPLGVRPLFYKWDGDSLTLCTDCRGLINRADEIPKPDPVTMRRFLGQNNFFHDEHSFFAGITRLMPGCLVKLNDGKIHSKRYWALDDVSEVRFKDKEEYGKRFLELLGRSVERRHVDSPVFGSGLSGGLDSSSIVCLVDQYRKSQHSDLPLPTATVTFQNTSYDETHLVDAVIEACNATNTATSPENWNLIDELEKLGQVHDEPFISMSATVFWIHKHIAADAGLHFLLSGAGADEVLAGELHYFADLLKAGRWVQLYREISGYAEINSMGHSRGKVALFLRYAVAPLMPEFVRKIRRSLAGETTKEWLGPELAAIKKQKEPLFSTRLTTQFHQEMSKTLQTRYTPLLLHYEDRNGAAFGIEGRFPFLDPEFVEYCYGVPRECLMSEGYAKLMLKDGMAGILPEPVLARKAKSGIPDLWRRWLTQDYRDRVLDIFANSRLVEDGWLEQEGVNNLYQRYCDGDLSLRVPLWRVIALENWYRNFWPNK